MRAAACFVGLDAINAITAEQVIGAREQLEIFKQAMRNQRQKGVEFQAARGAGSGNHTVVADNQHRRLRSRLGNHRIHFAGHDGRASLTRRQANLAETRIRTGGEQPQIGADLDQ